MSNVDYDLLLNQQKTRLEAATHRMKTTRAQFIDAVGRAIAPWYVQHIEAMVADQIAVGAALTDEKMKAFREETLDLSAKAKTEVDKLFGSPGLWWEPSQGGKPTHSYAWEKRPPKVFEMPINSVCALADSILRKYGYNVPKLVGGVQSVAWSHEVVKLANEYEEHQKEAAQHIQQIEQLGEQQARAGVMKRWNST